LLSKSVLFLIASAVWAVEPGALPLTWTTGGPNCIVTPDWQIHEYNPDFYILRESGCTNYEKPFLYLIFGKERVLLLDTGAGKTVDTRSIVHQVIGRWLKREGRTEIRLLVTHSHGHGDHVAGDTQFRNVAGVEFVEPDVKAVQTAFGIQSWPDANGAVDLGDRVLDVIPIPGHQEASIALYDRKTGVLLTGDSVYPGRLYVSDWEQYRASIQRLVLFTEGKVVAHVLGCHIEQTRQPYLDYPVGTTYQPDEHSLEMGRAELLELDEALHKLGSTPTRAAYRDFTIWPVKRKVLKQSRERQRPHDWSTRYPEARTRSLTLPAQFQR